MTHTRKTSEAYYPNMSLDNLLKKIPMEIAAVLTLIAITLSGCTTTVIGSCPPDRCIGPYDLTLSSHRQALEN